MVIPEHATQHLHGYFRDVLKDADGRVIWDRGWQENVIVDNCRRLLAGLVDGLAGTTAVTGLRVGFGLAAWDTAGTPPPSATTTQLIDNNVPTPPPRGFFVQKVPPPLPAGSPPGTPTLQLDFIDPTTGAPVGTPTNRLQLFATIGPGFPPWPDPGHPAPTLREFGLVAQLGGTEVLLNYRTHPAIAKDPTSTLERTIWLVF
jgi:hypothetical protein